MSSIEDKPSLLFHQNYLQNILPYLDNKDVAVLLQLNTKCNETGNTAITMLAEMEARSAPLQNDEKTKLQVPAKKRWTDYRDGQEIGKKIAIIEKFTKVYALRRKLFERIRRIDENSESLSIRRRIISFLNPVNFALVSCGEVVMLIAEMAQHLFRGIHSAFFFSQPAEKTLAVWHFRKLGYDALKFLWVITCLGIPLSIFPVLYLVSFGDSIDFPNFCLSNQFNQTSISKKMQDNTVETVLQCALVSLPNKIANDKDQDIIFWDHLGRGWEFQHQPNAISENHKTELVLVDADCRITLSEPNSFTPKGQKIAKIILDKLT